MPMTCEIELCSRPILARKACKLHYNRWKANRNRWIGYWKEADGNWCDSWTGENLSDGRPCFHWRDITTRQNTKIHAMRAALLISLGPTGKSPDLEAAHGCHNPLCVNPLHGFWATKKQNMTKWVPENVKPYLP